MNVHGPATGHVVLMTQRLQNVVNIECSAADNKFSWRRLYAFTGTTFGQDIMYGWVTRRDPIG